MSIRASSSQRAGLGCDQRPAGRAGADRPDRYRRRHRPRLHRPPRPDSDRRRRRPGRQPATRRAGMAARTAHPQRPAGRASRRERACRQPGNRRQRAGAARIDHRAGATAAADDDAAAGWHPGADRQRQRDRRTGTAVSSRVETARRAATPVWARVALALLALAGLGCTRGPAPEPAGAALATAAAHQRGARPANDRLRRLAAALGDLRALRLAGAQTAPAPGNNEARTAQLAARTPARAACLAAARRARAAAAVQPPRDGRPRRDRHRGPRLPGQRNAGWDGRGRRQRRGASRPVPVRTAQDRSRRAGRERARNARLDRLPRAQACTGDDGRTGRGTLARPESGQDPTATVEGKAAGAAAARQRARTTAGRLRDRPPSPAHRPRRAGRTPSNRTTAGRRARTRGHAGTRGSARRRRLPLGRR